MRVGVIRGDLSGPLFLSDLEPTSQVNPNQDEGQTRYLTRPSVVNVAAYLAAQSLAASAADLITATVPVGGPLNVAPATIRAVTGLSGATNTQVTALQDLLAPRIVETVVAKASWQKGCLFGLRSASFSPDPNRFATGAAIAVVADDGSTPFTV
jgi:hypothetical protein